MALESPRVSSEGSVQGVGPLLEQLCSLAMVDGGRGHEADAGMAMLFVVPMNLDTALIGTSSLPVWKMLAVSSSIPGGDRITEDYAQLIAVDVAYAYFTNLSKTLRNALQNETGKSGPDAVAAAEKILVRLNEIEQEARDMLRAEYQKGMQVVELSRSLQLLHQSLNAGMPTNIFQSMMVFNR